MSNVTRRMRQRQDPRRSATEGEEPKGPIVVGGVGGSGTRVVEEIMRRLDIYTGSDLNVAGDNRWFTFLCKLPRWDMEAPAPKSSVSRALATLETAMTGRVEFSAQDRRTLDEALRRDRHWWRYDRLSRRPAAGLAARPRHQPAPIGGGRCARFTRMGVEGAEQPPLRTASAYPLW